MDELAEAPPQQQVIDGEPDLVTVKPSGPRKRKAREDGTPAQPRRLTRSHEACARCRRKKSKCDSKHPSCSACLAAGVECVQEDRYRQTLKPRGYTDLLEAQIDKCAALLNKFIPGFKLEYLDYHLSNYGVALQPPDAGQAAQLFHSQYMNAEQLGGGEGMEGYDPAAAAAAAAAAGSYSGGPAYPPNVDPSGQGRVDGEGEVSGAATDPATASRGLYEQQSLTDQIAQAKGADPLGNDMSHSAGLVTAFGITKTVAKGIKQDIPLVDDILGGIPLTRITPLSKPHDPASWSDIPIPRNRSHQEQRAFVLPRDQAVAQQVLTVYFAEFNPYRPIFDEIDMREKIDFLYAVSSPDPDIRARAMADGATEGSKFKDVVDDSGFLCSVYLVLAMGTLAILNKRIQLSETVHEVWPSHEELYDHALGLRPDLQNSITTLQALCALHWYLYTERHGKLLWRLVGNIMRLAVELGLHHDPADSKGIFTPAESQLRMRLWLICLIYDRSTAIVFGRPLTVQRADFNTPMPSRLVQKETGEEYEAFSQHFEFSSELLHIQGDIVNSLYRPGKLTGEQIVLRAIEIERSVEAWRKKMPGSYQKLFGATSTGLVRAQKIELMSTVKTDRGVTMLQYGIMRMFLLRAIFNNRLVSAHVRHKALHDAVITAHNVLMVQTQLAMSPEVSFFTSPVPVHVAAMIIIFASISKVETLAWGQAREDVGLALKLVPLFRWRWQPRQDESSHTLILRLADKVYGAMEVEQGPLSPPMLLDEMYWLSETMLNSDAPPRIEDVWNPPQTGSTPPGLPTHLGGEHHTQKLSQKPQATLQEQEARFVAATEATASTAAGAAVVSAMDIDRPSAAQADDDPDNYDVEGVENLLSNMSDQGSPQTSTLSARNGNGAGFNPVAGVAAAADAGEYYEAWSKRTGEAGASGAGSSNGPAGGSGAA